MNEEQFLWEEIEKLLPKYQNSEKFNSFDFQKFALYSLIAHSTAIEGSTLSELDTQLLFDDGITAGGKPLVHHLMNEDLRGAYIYVEEKIQEKSRVRRAHPPVTELVEIISADFLKICNAKIMKSTGGIMNTANGSFNSANGDFRLCGVIAGVGGKSYMNYQKIEPKILEFCNKINEKIALSDIKNCYRLSFEAHYDLATIHPWIDGNGRTARLVMNYIQALNNFPMLKVYKEDKKEYILTLQKSQSQEDNLPFIVFMQKQLVKMLSEL